MYGTHKLSTSDTDLFRRYTRPVTNELDAGLSNSTEERRDWEE